MFKGYRFRNEIRISRRRERVVNASLMLQKVVRGHFGRVMVRFAYNVINFPALFADLFYRLVICALSVWKRGTVRRHVRCNAPTAGA